MGAETMHGNKTMSLANWAGTIYPYAPLAEHHLEKSAIGTPSASFRQQW